MCPLEVEQLSTCTMLNFNVGSYRAVVLPSVNKLLVDNEYNIGETIVKISESKYGFDKKGKNVEIQKSLMIREDRIVLHCYNTNFRMKADGRKQKSLLPTSSENYLQRTFTI